MQRLTLAFLVLAVLGATVRAEAPAARVRLHPVETLPAGEEVLLGQVADIRGPAADSMASLSVGSAPGPGRRRVITRSAIVRILAAAGHGADAVLVEGAAQLRLVGSGQRLDPQRVREVLQTALSEILPRGEVVIEDVRLPAGLQLPTGEYELRAGPLPRQPHSGRQRLVVEVVFADGTRRRVGVQAQVRVRGPMLVAARDVSRGEPLREVDLRLEVREYRNGSPVLTDPAQAIGKVVRTPLRREQPLRANLIHEALAVETGQTVVAVFRSGGVLLEMETRARGKGGVGNIIPVASQDGRKTLRARIIGPGRVALLGSEEGEQ